MQIQRQRPLKIILLYIPCWKMLISFDWTQGLTRIVNQYLVQESLQLSMKVVSLHLMQCRFPLYPQRHSFFLEFFPGRHPMTLTRDFQQLYCKDIFKTLLLVYHSHGDEFVDIVTFLIRLHISFKGHRCEHRIGNGVFSNKYALS